MPLGAGRGAGVALACTRIVDVRPGSGRRSTVHELGPMTIADCDAVIDLMKKTPGVSFREAGSREFTARCLQRDLIADSAAVTP
jgi:hypothetical protein